MRVTGHVGEALLGNAKEGRFIERALYIFVMYPLLLLYAIPRPGAASGGHPRPASGKPRGDPYHRGHLVEVVVQACEYFPVYVEKVLPGTGVLPQAVCGPRLQ